MTTTLTLKNIPDSLYERLKATALLNRRSLNSEVIVQLETALLANRVSPLDRLTKAQVLRGNLLTGPFTAAEIDAAKQDGRP